MDPDVVVRTADEHDIDSLAALRWVWALPDEPAEVEALQEFTTWLAGWMSAHREDVLCKIAVIDGRLIGMAWLAIYERVPNPDNRRRRSGDVQSVFVLPQHRGRGIGRRLVTDLCTTANELGIRSITVRPSPAVAAFYEQLGFARSHPILERYSPPPPPAADSAE